MSTVLYVSPLSANSYRAKLVLDLLGVSHETRKVDLRTGEHRRQPFLSLNPLGHVPVLDEDGRIIRDSHAIVFHVAQRHGKPWLPDAVHAEILQWLFFDATELHHGIGLARNQFHFGIPTNLEAAQSRATKAMGVLEARLKAHDWLVGDSPTLADLACYPFVSIRDQAGIHGAWPALEAWSRRIETLPGFRSMPHAMDS